MSVPYPLISDTAPWVQSIAGLNQFVYSTTWTADTASDILVYSRTSIVDANDGTQLVSSNDYSVAFIGDENIVQVTFGALVNPPQGNIVTIMRNTPSDRMNLYTNTNFTASMLNSDFGTLTLIDQDLALSTDKFSPHYYNSSTTQSMDPVTGLGYDEILPVLGANQFWAKDDDNLQFIAVSLNNGELPIAGPFVIYEADAGLAQGFNLGLLGNGILAQTVLAGTATPYVIPIPVTTSIGGSGLTSTTPYALLLGGETPIAPFAQITDLGTAGYVLTSNGAGANPSFQNPIYIEGIVGTANQINVVHTLDPNVATISLSSTMIAPGTFTIAGTVVADAIINDNTMTTATATNLSTSSAIKAYADTIAAGFSVISACVAATTTNFDSTYANGASGVGATLTALVNGAAGNVDGIVMVLSSRVLFKDQTTTFQNGVYTLTTIGDGATPAVFTRATDYDTAADIAPGELVPILEGTVNSGSIWLQTQTVAAVGTSAIIFSIFVQPANTYVTLATTQTVTGTKTFVTPVLGAATGTSLSLSGELSAGSASFTTALPVLSGGTGVTTSTGSGSVVRATSPTLVTPVLGASSATSITFSSTSGIIGTTTNDNAAAGSVGQEISSKVVRAAGITLTTAVVANLTTISLTAGDWDVGGNTVFENTAGAMTTTQSSTNQTSLNLGGIEDRSYLDTSGTYIIRGSNVPTSRVSLSSPATMFLVVAAHFSSGTTKVSGNLFARRVR